ncbi:MAG TPA: CPBP family intramembrane glutamic endopeptidase [Candidatus Eisenbacteria bacterium]|nr:CPBP family intramembrane glutamic endopeptidase [Candidatus Eisenbacteria bacterium]
MGFPFAWRHLSRNLAAVQDDLRIIAIEWTVTLLIALYAFGFEHRTWADLSLRKITGRDVLAMVAAIAGGSLLAGIAGRFVRTPATFPDLRQLAALQTTVRVALVRTAGICEEFLYRGFAIEEIGRLAGSRWLGAGVSLLLFTIGHGGLYGWTSALIIPFIIGTALTLLYMWRRNLPVCMLMHAGVDAWSLLVAPS